MAVRAVNPVPGSGASVGWALGPKWWFAAVALGALTRIFALVQVIKNSGKSTVEIDHDLQIVGSVAAGPDLSAIQPVLTAKVVGAHVAIGWGWQGNAAWLSSCEILVDRADGKGFNLLTIDTTPNYADTQPFPAAKAIWTYKAIYRQGDAQVGVWSQTVSMTAGAATKRMNLFPRRRY